MIDFEITPIDGHLPGDSGILGRIDLHDINEEVDPIADEDQGEEEGIFMLQEEG